MPGGTKVTAKVNVLCYRIQKTPTSRSIVVHVDHLKLYEGGNPVENWLRSDAPSEASETSEGETGEIVSEYTSVSQGVTDLPITNSDPKIPENVISQHSDHDAAIPCEPKPLSVPSTDMDETMPYGMDKQDLSNSDFYTAMPYETISPSVPSTDMDETIPYGMDEQVMPNSDLDATMPYGTTSLLVPSADMDETLPYGVAVQVMPHSNLYATMPYETVLASGSSPDVEEMVPCGVEEPIQNADIDITIPYENTPQSVPSTDLGKTMPYDMDEVPDQNSKLTNTSTHLPAPSAVPSTAPEDTFLYTPSQHSNVNTDLNDTIPYVLTQQPSSPLHVTISDGQGLVNTGGKDLKVLQDTVVTPDQTPKDSVVSTEFAQPNSVGQGAATSAPCKTSKPATNDKSISGMTNPVDDDARPLAIRRTRRPLKPQVILDL